MQLRHICDIQQKKGPQSSITSPTQFPTSRQRIINGFLQIHGIYVSPNYIRHISVDLRLNATVRCSIYAFPSGAPATSTLRQCFLSNSTIFPSLPQWPTVAHRSSVWKIKTVSATGLVLPSPSPSLSKPPSTINIGTNSLVPTYKFRSSINSQFYMVAHNPFTNKSSQMKTIG